MFVACQFVDDYLKIYMLVCFGLHFGTLLAQNGAELEPFWVIFGLGNHPRQCHLRGALQVELSASFSGPKWTRIWPELDPRGPPPGQQKHPRSKLSNI